MSIFTFPIAVMAVMTNITAVNRLRDARKDLEMRELFPFGPPVTAKRASAVVVLLLASMLGTGPGKEAMARMVTDSLSAVHFPTPMGINGQLFYLQRNSNTNTVIYQLNLDGQGQVNRREPVHVFWIRYAEGGQPKELTFIQRRFAYGLHAKQVEPDAYELRFVSYAKFTLYLARSAVDNQYRVYATIDRRKAVLQRIFLRIEGGSFWAPNVRYVELKGVDAATGADLLERIKV